MIIGGGRYPQNRVGWHTDNIGKELGSFWEVVVFAKIKMPKMSHICMFFLRFCPILKS